ncbi:MAG TPA: substrate-binding domain-containing protein [Chloroflexota bacterium]
MASIDQSMTRRQILRLGALGAVTAALAACGGAVSVSSSAGGVQASASVATSAAAKPAGSASAAAAGSAKPAASAAASAQASTGATSLQGAQLRVLVWSHFVPAYDTFFDQFVKDWGDKNGVKASVDHITNTDIPGRMAAEVAAKAGHDLVGMNGAPQLQRRFKSSLIELDDVVTYASGKLGKVFRFGEAYNHFDDHWYGFPEFYIAIVPLVRNDLFQSIGEDPAKVTSWDDYRRVGMKLKPKGNPGGFAISHCNDSQHNWQSIMYSFGASWVKEDGKTSNIDTPEMRDALSWMAGFYKDSLTPEVFAWDDTSDNRWLQSGQGGFIHDAISSYRSIEGTNKDLFEKISIQPIPKGPKTALNRPDTNNMVIYNFAPKQNQEAGKAFLKYYADQMPNMLLQQSAGYNMPMYENLFKKPMAVIGNDPKLQQLQDYKGDDLTTIGFPGPPTAEAINFEANYVFSDMVGIAVRGNSKDAIGDAIKFGNEQFAKFYPK